MRLWDFLQPQAAYHVTHASTSIADVQLRPVDANDVPNQLCPSLLAGRLSVSSLVDNGQVSSGTAAWRVDQRIRLPVDRWRCQRDITGFLKSPLAWNISSTCIKSFWHAYAYWKRPGYYYDERRLKRMQNLFPYTACWTDLCEFPTTCSRQI